MFAYQVSPEDTHSSEQQVPQKKRFLVIEDDLDIANLMSMHLKDLDAEITIIHNGLDGLKKAKEGHWDTILLDLQLPGMDGLDLCRTLRAETSMTPIVMVTSRSTELDRVLGLEIGADDYLVKPFSMAELKARVKALLRRSQHTKRSPSPTQQRLSFKGLEIDTSSHKAHLEGQLLELTAKEFDLLWFFASQPGKVFKRGELLDKVWGYGHDGYEHTVNSHINRLRAKLEKDPSTPNFIQTVWGVGYRFGE